MQLKTDPISFLILEILNLKDETDKRKEDKEDQEQTKEYRADQLKHREEKFNAILAYRGAIRASTPIGAVTMTICVSLNII